MGFESYFLIVWDFVRYSQENGVRGRPGPGSAAARSSPTAGHHRLVRSRNGLLLERSSTAARESMPDIDIDFSVRSERVSPRTSATSTAASRSRDHHLRQMAPRRPPRRARVLGLDPRDRRSVAKRSRSRSSGRIPSFEECYAGASICATPTTPIGDTRQIVDAARGLGDASAATRSTPRRWRSPRPSARRHRSPRAAGRATGRRNRQRANGPDGSRRRASVQVVTQLLDGPDRGSSGCRRSTPRPAQPRRDRGHGGTSSAASRGSRSSWSRSLSTTPRPSRCWLTAAFGGRLPARSGRACAIARRSGPTRVRRHRRARVATLSAGSDAAIADYARRQARLRLGRLPDPRLRRSPRRRTAAASTRSS